MRSFTPRPYQEAGIELMLREPGVGLFLEPGSGKTVTALTAADILLNERWAVQKVLVVAPKIVAQEVWAREAAKWQHTAHLKVAHLDAAVFEYYRKVTTSAVLGNEVREIVENDMSLDDQVFLLLADVAVSKTELLCADPWKTRDAILRRSEQIHVISRDHFYMLVRILGSAWPYDMVLGDESTMWKNHDSKRSQTIRYLRSEELVRFLTVMSGTPSPRGLENLFAQVRLLDNGRRLGDKITHFRKAFMLPGEAGRNKHTGRHQIFSWVAQPGATERVTNLISDICLAVRADVWRETDPPRTVEHPVRLPDEAIARYKELQDNYHLALEDGEVTAESAAVLSNKLIQVASGAVFDSEQNYHVLHDAKLDALEELVEELDGQPLLIVYWFKPTLDRLRKRFGAKLATTKTKGFLDRFGRGELPLLALQPGSAAHGLDGLQDGGHQIAMVDMFHDWELYQQAVSRLDRSGQKHQVTVHQFLARGTKDLQVARVLADKGADQGRVMDALKFKA